jgi:predicted dehydrogenase
MNKVRWGILSTAKIGLEKVIPAMQKGQYSLIDAIASRNLVRAQKAAEKLNIPKSYGNYEQLLADPDIDAVYIPLPNHLHVPWSRKALQAGKHVLCEKPIGLTLSEAQELLRESKQYPQLKIMEAFMYRHHPQWQLAKKWIEEGKIGDLQAIQSFFSYHNLDPNNIRNKADIGGGGLMDIGCYCISLSRFIFSDEPFQVYGVMTYDPQLNIDRLTSGLLHFKEGTSIFTCATQTVPYQRVKIFGTKGYIEIEIPFNAPPEKPCKIWYGDGNDIKEVVLEICDQYTIQGDLFSQAIFANKPVPTPLEDALANMLVVEAIVKSNKQGKVVEI